MVDFRQLPGVEDATADGQLYNSEDIAPDMFYACTWEALRQTARAYGYGGFDDEQLRHIGDFVLGRPPNHFGERWETNLAVAQHLWPALGLDMVVWYPNDLVGGIRFATQQGWRVHCGFWCDQDAWVPAQGPITYSHCLMNLWDDGAGIGWRNPEPHPDVYLSDDQVRALYDGGGLLVFKRALIAPPVITRRKPLSDIVTTTLRQKGDVLLLPGVPYFPRDRTEVNLSAIEGATSLLVYYSAADGRSYFDGERVILGPDVPDISAPPVQVIPANPSKGRLPDGAYSIKVVLEGAAPAVAWPHREDNP